MVEQNYKRYLNYNSLRVSSIKPKEFTSLLNKVVLCRHGKTSYNTGGQIQGSTDIPLSTIGINEVQQDAISLNVSSLIIKYICSSDMKRAEETASIYSTQLKIAQTTSIPLLREYGSGIWEGCKTTDLIKFDPYHNIWTEKPITYSFGSIPENGESFLDFLDRVYQGVSLLLNLSNGINDDEKLLVVSHATVNRAIRFLYLLSREVGDDINVSTAQMYEKHIFYSQSGNFIKIPHGYFGIDTTNYSFVK
ncbi:phosphoglycerate mutase family protein [Candidatus Woesebacteria bacterium]|nr:phosphoglycerate mutase family protein [Candidatus Woesebacteria bacterium]